MAESKKGKTLADNGVHILCQDQDTHGLTAKQITALHACKFSIIAAIENLYVTLPPKQADPILSKYIKV
jgi:hypothetical protein